MRTASRFIPIATCAAAAALLGGCTSTRTVSLNVPTPAPAATVAAAPVAVAPATTAVVPAAEFGRITNIEYFPGGTAASRINVPGAVVGGVAGAVVGNQVGRGLGGSRDAATVLGGAAGAAIGANAGTAPAPADANNYRVTIQTDAGAFRTYDVPATGDLRIGDRVHVENGVIYRS